MSPRAGGREILEHPGDLSEFTYNRTPESVSPESHAPLASVHERLYENSGRGGADIRSVGEELARQVLSSSTPLLPSL